MPIAKCMWFRKAKARITQLLFFLPCNSRLFVRKKREGGERGRDSNKLESVVLTEGLDSGCSSE